MAAVRPSNAPVHRRRGVCPVPRRRVTTCLPVAPSPYWPPVPDRLDARPRAGHAGGSASRAARVIIVRNHVPARHDIFSGTHGDVDHLLRAIPGPHDGVWQTYEVAHAVYGPPPTLCERSETTHGKAEGRYARDETMYVISASLRMLPEAGRHEPHVIHVRAERSRMPRRGRVPFDE
jgi:hypothetical protein